MDKNIENFLKKHVVFHNGYYPIGICEITFDQIEREELTQSSYFVGMPKFELTKLGKNSFFKLHAHLYNTSLNLLAFIYKGVCYLLQGTRLENIGFI